MAKKKVSSSKKSGMKPIKLSKRGFIIISLLLLVIIGVELYFVSSDDVKTENTTVSLEQNDKGVDTTIKSVDVVKKDDVKSEAKKGDTIKNVKESKTATVLSQIDKSSAEPNRTLQGDTSQGVKAAKNVNQSEVISDKLELPRITDKGYVVYNEEGRYTIYYSVKHKQPFWVAYTLTDKDMEQKNVDRSDDFRPDMRLVSRGWPVAQLSDYKGSSYDRGHLVPSADRNDTKPENSATFLLSNISPQTGSLNRFAWSALENEVRRLAKKYEIIYVVTGGVLNFEGDKPVKVIGDNLTVPEKFYKVLLVKNKDKYYAVGYLIPNLEDCGRDFKLYTVSVDSVEKVTNIDFFPALNNSIEEEVENHVDTRFWSK